MQITIDQAFPAALQLQRYGRFDEAITLLEQAYGLVPQPLFLFEAAGMQMATDRRDAARANLERIEEAHPEFEPGQRFMAVVRAMDAGQEIQTVRLGEIEANFEITGQNWELESCWLDGSFYEPTEIEAIARHLPEGTSFVDIGANAGNHTVYVALARPDVTVIPVEPEPRAAATLLRNAHLNELENVVPTHVGRAVAAERGTIHLQFRNSSSSTRRSPDGCGIEVETIDLASLLDANTGFVKIDVEGMEVEILDASRDALANYDGKLMLEVLTPQRAAIESCLARHGLEIVERIPMHAGENIIAQRPR